MSAPMRSTTRTLLVDIENVTGSHVDADGFLTVTCDVDGEQGSVPHEVHHLGGLWYCPLDPVTDPNSGAPDPSQAGQALTLAEGGGAHCLLLSNPKTVKTLPIGVKGETMVFNDFGAFSRWHKDGSITHSTTTAGGASSGQTVADRILPDSFIRFAPWGRETFNMTGWRVSHVGGGALKLGTAGGLAPGLSSYFRATADMIELNGSAVHIGPTGSIIQPVAQALPLSAILTNIATALQAVQVAIGSITSISPGSAALPALIPIIETAVASIASAMTTMPTRTAIG